jgi:hypothetical protein
MNFEVYVSYCIDYAFIAQSNRDATALHDRLSEQPARRARRLIIVEGETCAAPVTAGRATTGSAIGAAPLSNVVKLISERDWAGACCRISKE